MQERAWVRWGGWAAVAAGALTLALIAAQIAAVRSPGAARQAVWLLIFVGCASLFAAKATFEALRPPSWVTRGGFAVEGAGACVLAFGDVPRELGVREVVPLLSFGWVLIGFWMISVAAAGWRLKRLPVWLRVYGAALGALLMLLPALPETASLDLLLSLPWWFGLGLTLLRLPKSGSIPVEAATQA